MKKLLCCLLALSLLCAPMALADVGARMRVTNCNEYITLREEPDTSAAALARLPLGAYVDEVGSADNDFMCVSYRGKTGYALGQYLTEVDDYAGDTVTPTDQEHYNINLFLSNFTEAGFMWRGGCYDEEYPNAAALTRFGVNHCWFNRQDRCEWGDYFNGNNVRLPEDQVTSAVKKYFGASGFKPDHSADLYDYKSGYYYWQETGGHTKDGFASLYDVGKLGNRRYGVRFYIYGMGEDWTNDVCNYASWEAEEAYPPYGNIPRGYAVIDVGSSGLGDRSDWRLIRYAVSYE